MLITITSELNQQGTSTRQVRPSKLRKTIDDQLIQRIKKHPTGATVQNQNFRQRISRQNNVSAINVQVKVNKVHEPDCHNLNES